MPKLAKGEVRVWPIRLTAPDLLVRQFEAMLAPEERGRAARFRFDHLRPPFILSHGALRILLGHELGIPPAEVRLAYGEKGKPALAPPANLSFNMSHSGGFGLFALTLDCDIGADVEHIRSIRDMAAIANRFFCAEEASELMSLEPEEQQKAFFRCWTRKEAFIKALGEGLHVPLDSFRVTLLPGAPAEFRYIRHKEAASKSWILHNLDFLPDYAAALVYTGAPRAVHLFPPATPAELLETR